MENNIAYTELKEIFATDMLIDDAKLKLEDIISGSNPNSFEVDENGDFKDKNEH